ESADGLVSIEQSSDASFEKPTDRTERPHRRADNVQRQVVRAQRGHRPYRADLTDARAPAAKVFEFDERDIEIHENVPPRPRRIYRLERHTPDLKFGGRADGDAAFALQDFARLSGDVARGERIDLVAIAEKAADRRCPRNLLQRGGDTRATLQQSFRLVPRQIR